MDFERWLRAQLAAGPEPFGPRPLPGRRRPAPPRRTAALQVLVGAIALAVIAIGLFSVDVLPTLQIRVLARGGPALPVDTWAGLPPPPADAIPAVAEVQVPVITATTSAPVPVRTPADPGSRIVPSSPASSAAPEHRTPSPTPPSEGTNPEPSTPTASASSAFTLKGGTVTASCRSGRIATDSVAPNPGFESDVNSSDGGRVVAVRLRSENFESEVQLWCSAGLVQSQIREGTR